jgi:oxygen-independent coproporphyrinogen-3 oxidase
MALAYQQGRLHRNFMGYTLKPADEYIGLGPSAIGFAENTYVQNTKVLPEYYKMIANGQLPIERGLELTLDDQMRRWVINRWMCSFKVSKHEFQEQFGHDFDTYFSDEMQHIKECQEDDLLIQQADTLQATSLGRLFIRNICMGFDAYLRKEGAHKRFSRTV